MVRSKGSFVALCLTVLTFCAGGAGEVFAQSPLHITLRCQYTYKTLPSERSTRPVGQEAKPCVFQVLLSRTNESGSEETQTFLLSESQTTNGILFQGTYFDLIEKLSTSGYSEQASRFADGWFSAALTYNLPLFVHTRGTCQAMKNETTSTAVHKNGIRMITYLDRSPFLCWRTRT